MKRYVAVLLSLFATFSQAQTITPNESKIVLQSPKKIGINLNTPTYYQGGEIYKNLLWRNPGFEPDLYRDKFVAFKAGTTTTFPSPDFYDPVGANFWTGATFRLYRGSNPRTVACSGTIAGNTVSSGQNGPVYSFSSACSTAVQEGDVIILRNAIACTAETVWENSGGGWWGSASGGGKLLSECTAPYDGKQSLRMDASAHGSSAGVRGFIDTNPSDVGILINGKFAITGMYRTIGAPILSVSAERLVTPATGNPFRCNTQNFGPSTAWTSFTVTCMGSETSKVTAGSVQVQLTAQSGIVLLDNVSFERTDTDPSNTTVFRDELIATLRAHCAGASLTGIPCELRDWAFQNADEISNTVKPIFERSPSLPGANYDVPPNGAVSSVSVGLEEFLELCEAIGAEPYYTLPETTGPEDASSWIEYLNGATSTPYGAQRAAHGHTASWLSIFPTIHLPMGNENWNEGITGQGLGFRAGAPDLYYDYSVDAAGVWSAMRASASWPAGGSGIDLVLGFQNGNANNGITEAWNRAQPNSGELAPYTQAYIGDVAPLTSLWNPLFYEVANNTTNPNLAFFQQGSAIKAHGRLNVYEFDNATSAGGTGLTQTVLDSFTDAAGYGTATALQALQHLSFGIVDQNFFSLDQYATNMPNLGWVHQWGAVIDMGGATNAVRPQELGMRMANAAIIGPMYSCPVANPTTYNLLANHNGSDSSGMPATKNVPQQYAYCFMSGSKRSMIVINTDVTTAHTLNFAGSQAPTGTVTVTRYAPASISANNEGKGILPTNAAVQSVSISVPVTLSSPAGDSLPPYSITRYDWTSGVSEQLASTTTSLSASSYSVGTGALLTLNAAVASNAAAGSVVFQQNGVTVGTGTLVKGAVALTFTASTAGTFTYTAAYSGDSAYAASTSSPITVTVGGSSSPSSNPSSPSSPSSNLKASSTALSFSTTSASVGSTVHITATMNSAAVTGSVTLYDGAAKLGTTTISLGHAWYSVRQLAPGTHTFTAKYGGSSVYAASQSPSGQVKVSGSIVLMLTPSNRTPAVGTRDALSAAFNCAGSTGLVYFFDGKTQIGTAPVRNNGAVFTTNPITAGNHSYTAVYKGTSAFPAVTSAAVTVVPAAAAKPNRLPRPGTRP